MIARFCVRKPSSARPELLAKAKPRILKFGEAPRAVVVRS
jgi:hypothetical protein